MYRKLWSTRQTRTRHAGTKGAPALRINTSVGSKPYFSDLKNIQKNDISLMFRFEQSLAITVCEVHRPPAQARVRARAGVPAGSNRNQRDISKPKCLCL